MLRLCALLLVAVAPAFAQTPAGNLLANPGFEERDPRGAAVAWTPGGKAEIARDAAGARTGEGYARVRFDDRVFQAVDCDPGVYYVIDAWVRAENPQTVELPRIKVYFLARDGSRALVSGGQAEKPGADGWEHFSVPLRAPQNAARISIALIGAYGGNDWFRFDDVSVRRLAAHEWPDPEQTPDLHGKTVVAPGLADVHSFALYRVPPASQNPIDGLLTTAAWTGRAQSVRSRPPTCDLDITFARPASFNWVLIHALSPTRGLGTASLEALPDGRSGEGRLLAAIGGPEQLIHSLSVDAPQSRGLRLRLPDADQRTAEIHEIQALRIGDALPAGWEGFPAASGPVNDDDRALCAQALAAESDRTALAPGEGTVEVAVPAAGQLSILGGLPGADTGVRSVVLDMAVRSAGEAGVVEVCLMRPAALDVSIRYAELSDRGETARLGELRPRECASLVRVLSRFSGPRLTVALDVPDFVLPAGEKLWLTVRSEKGLTVDPSRTQVRVQTCTVAEALPEYLPELERLATRAYALASEAHAYDGKPYDKMILHEIVQRVLAYEPGNRPANHILARVARRWRPVAVERPGPEDAPDWAVWGRHAAREWLRIADWWIDNRWVENGELGGDLNDDVEYTCHWPLIYLITGDERIRTALGAIADAVWEQSGGTGYSIAATDVEHAAEDSSCSLPQMLLCDYGNPVHVERMMKMSEHIPFWTGINDKGRRHFRSYRFNTTAVWDKPRDDVDHLYCALAMCGATHLAWYARNPQPLGWVSEYASAWAQVALSTDKGKPKYALPCDVHFKTGEIAPYTADWRQSVYYSFGQYVMENLLVGAAELVDDPAVSEVAERILGTRQRAIDYAAAAAGSYAPPQANPEAPQSLDKTWKGVGNERLMYQGAIASENGKALVAMLEEVAREFERTRWLITEAEPFTDRVPVPATQLLRFMFLGGDCAGKTHVPGLAASWEGGGTDFAAMLLDSETDRLKALVYGFSAEPLQMALRTWRLKHGRYRVSFGHDTDGDNVADQGVTEREAELFRHARVPFSLAPGKVTVISIELIEGLEPLEGRADVALSPRDVRRVGDREVAVTVHNIGASPAEGIRVDLVDSAGAVRASAGVAALPAPDQLKPVTAEVNLKADAPIAADWLVRLDPGDAIPEICEENNSVRVGEGQGRFVYLARRDRPR